MVITLILLTAFKPLAKTSSSVQENLQVSLNNIGYWCKAMKQNESKYVVVSSKRGSHFHLVAYIDSSILRQNYSVGDLEFVSEFIHRTTTK